MALTFNLANIENFETLCYDTVTEAEAEEAGTTFEELLAARSFMGPSWSVMGSVSDLEKLTGEEPRLVRMNLVTHSLIFASIPVGIGEISEDTEIEFYARLALSRKLRGPMLYVEGENGESVPRPITFAEVQAHRGLTTNVSAVTWSEWVRSTLDESRRHCMNEDNIGDIALPQNQLQPHEIIEEAWSALERAARAVDQADFESPEVAERASRLAGRNFDQIKRYLRGLEDMAEKWVELAERDQEWIESIEGEEE